MSVGMRAAGMRVREVEGRGGRERGEGELVASELNQIHLYFKRSTTSIDLLSITRIPYPTPL